MDRRGCGDVGVDGRGYVSVNVNVNAPSEMHLYRLLLVRHLMMIFGDRDCVDVLHHPRPCESGRVGDGGDHDQEIYLCGNETGRTCFQTHLDNTHGQ